MSIDFKCLLCGSPISVAEEQAGSRVNCPSCGKTVAAPSPIGGKLTDKRLPSPKGAASGTRAESPATSTAKPSQEPRDIGASAGSPKAAPNVPRPRGTEPSSPQDGQGPDLQTQQRTIRVIVWALAILGGLLLITGLLAAPRSILLYLDARRSVGWPTVRGTVTESRVEESSAYARKQGPQKVYDARVAFTYEVEGAKYTSARYRVDPKTTYVSLSSAEAVVARYPVGSEVQAHYKPGDPSFAVLEPGTLGEDFKFFMPMINLLLGLPLLLLSLFVKRRASRRWAEITSASRDQL
jgi:hypothetical protein